MTNNYLICYDTDGWISVKFNNEKISIGYIEEVNEKLLQKFVDELNKKDKIIKKLKMDNDHKFWKLQFMRQYNETQLFTHELSKAIDQGYEMSDKFKKYLEDLKKFNEEGKKYAEEQEKW